MTRSRLAWGIAAMDISVILAVSLVSPDLGLVGLVIFGFGIGSFAAVGALLITRVPANPIGVLLLAAGTILGAAMVIGTYADLGALQVPPWPWVGPARLVQGTLFVYPFMIALVGVPLVFPDGRLPSRRFQWVVWIAIADMMAWTLGSILGAPLQDPGTAETFGSVALDPLRAALQAFFFVGTIVSFGAGAVAIWLRFRRGDPVQRQQVKWLVAVVGLGAIVLPLSFIPIPDGNPELALFFNSITILTLFALPIVIGIAILRYRLFEIDRIISRTIGWAVVTGVLVSVFAGAVVALQAFLASVTQGETLAVAASTLVAAVLLQPVRRRVQSAVDRRFDRSRYDGQRTVDAFAEHLRNEVDLPRLLTALVATADEAVRPVTATVWLRAASKAGR